MKILQKSILLIVFLIGSQAVQSEIRDDVHIQSDNDPVRLDIDSRTYNEIKRFFEQGYPATTVMLHGVSLGMAIDDVVNLAVRSNVARAQEFYDTAISLLPSLPGWACRLSGDENRYGQGYPVGDLQKTGTIQEVANRFFGNNETLIPFPDWLNDKGHISATVAEIDKLTQGAHWYTSGSGKDAKPNRPIFVSLYKDNGQIIIDGNYGLIKKALQDGISELDVVFIFNEENQRPVSRFGEDPLLADISTKFYSENEMLTPVPDWQQGEYHLMVSMDEIKQFFDLPARDAIDPDQWAGLEEEIRQFGFSRPMLITLLGNSKGIWLDEMERASVAADMGIQSVPSVLFFHNFNRLACGEEASCEEQVCNATIAAGGDPAICEATDADAGTQSSSPPQINTTSNASPS